METIKRHKVSIVLLIVMAFALALYLYLIPLITEEEKESDNTGTEETIKENPLAGEAYVWVRSEYIDDESSPQESEEEIIQKIVEEPINNPGFSIAFQSNTFDVVTDCGIIKGNYTVVDSQIEFTNTTLQDSPNCNFSQAINFQNSLIRSTSYIAENNKLTINLDKEGENMQFQKDIVIEETFETNQ